MRILLGTPYMNQVHLILHINGDPSVSCISVKQALTLPVGGQSAHSLTEWTLELHSVTRGPLMLK